MFVKVKDSEIVKFPFSFLDLQEENPYTKFDDRFSLVEWHKKTEGATIKGEQLFPVSVQPAPDYSQAHQKIVQKTLPTFTNGEWSLGWDVIEITEQEKQIALSLQNESTPTQI